MKHGTASLAEVLELLRRTDKVYCDLALFRNAESDPSWMVFRLFVDVVQGEGARAHRNFSYGQAAFISGSADGATVAQWLGGNQKGEIDSHQFIIAKVRDQVDWSRSSSHLRNAGYQRLTHYHSPFPHSLYRLSFQENLFDTLKQALNPDDNLIKVGCPTFPSYYTALTYLMHGVGRRLGDDVPPPEIVIRLVHNDAWIDEVTLGSKRVAVTVKGDRVAGVRLAVGCGGYHFEEDLEREVTLLCSNPRGIPDRIWIILSRQDMWLDGRDIDLQYGAERFLYDNIKAAPENIYEQIREWVSEGESNMMEYKRELSADERKVLKTTWLLLMAKVVSSYSALTITRRSAVSSTSFLKDHSVSTRIRSLT